jgi:hypothetical protein
MAIFFLQCVGLFPQNIIPVVTHSIVNTKSITIIKHSSAGILPASSAGILPASSAGILPASSAGILPASAGIMPVIKNHGGHGDLGGEWSVAQAFQPVKLDDGRWKLEIGR